MQFIKKTSSSRSIVGIVTKLVLLLLVFFLIIFLLNKIDFPAPKKDIDITIPNENFKIINSLISKIGYQFQIEKYVNKLDTLSAWSIGNQNFPCNRNRAFYLIAKKLENLDYYKEKNIGEIINTKTIFSNSFGILNLFNKY